MLMLFGERQDDVHRVVFFSSPSSPSILFCLTRLPLGPFCVTHFSRGSGGCTPRSSTASCCPQVWSVIQTDPPGLLPPRHVSVRHVILFMRLIRFFLLCPQRVLVLPSLLFSMPPLGLNFSFLTWPLSPASLVPPALSSVLLALAALCSVFSLGPLALFPVLPFSNLSISGSLSTFTSEPDGFSSVLSSCPPSFHFFLSFSFCLPFFLFPLFFFFLFTVCPSYSLAATGLHVRRHWTRSSSSSASCSYLLHSSSSSCSLSLQILPFLRVLLFLHWLCPFPPVSFFWHLSSSETHVLALPLSCVCSLSWPLRFLLASTAHLSPRSIIPGPHDLLSHSFAAPVQFLRRFLQTCSQSSSDCLRFLPTSGPKPSYSLRFPLSSRPMCPCCTAESLDRGRSSVLPSTFSEVSLCLQLVCSRLCPCCPCAFLLHASC